MPSKPCTSSHEFWKDDSFLLSHQYASTQGNARPLRVFATSLSPSASWVSSDPDDSPVSTHDLGSCIMTFPRPTSPTGSEGLGHHSECSPGPPSRSRLPTPAALLFPHPSPHHYGPGFHTWASLLPYFQTVDGWVMSIHWTATFLQNKIGKIQEHCIS